MTSIWIARDGDERLFVYLNKPIWDKDWKEWKSSWSTFKEIPKKQYPEIKSGECKEFELKEVVK